MIILITNDQFNIRGGTVLYVHELAIQLLARGHKPIVYSTKLGKQTRLLREAGIPVIDDLNQTAVAPDVIHGHFSIETMTALLQFPRVPAVYFCHDWFSGTDSPPVFPRILRYVGVDEPCYDKLVYEHSIAPERASLIFNFVDLERFQPRNPLPDQAHRALVFSNYAKEGAHLEAIRRACRAANIQLDVSGEGVGSSSNTPERLLRQYDIVFAKGRAALEALAVGATVIVHSGISCLGQMVSDENLDNMILHNFGLRELSPRLTPAELERKVRSELTRYDVADAAKVSRRIRATANCDLAVNKIISLYQEVIDEYQQLTCHDTDAEMRAVANFLRVSTVLHTNQEAAIARYENSVPMRVAKRIRQIPVLGNVAKTIADKIAR